MKIFKESKNQPIKFRGFKYIGFDENHPNVCYYYKNLDRNNFEIMTCHLEGDKKPEIGAGTNVNVIDCFMAFYLHHSDHFISCKSLGTLAEDTINTTFYDYDDKEREAMIKKYSSKIPSELKFIYDLINNGDYRLLYCSNDESDDRKLGVVNIVLVKEDIIKSDQLELNKHYTVFKPMKFMTAPKYLKGESKAKYIEVPLNEIVIDNDLLI